MKVLNTILIDHYEEFEITHLLTTDIPDYTNPQFKDEIMFLLEQYRNCKKSNTPFIIPRFLKKDIELWEKYFFDLYYEKEEINFKNINSNFGFILPKTWKKRKYSEANDYENYKDLHTELAKIEPFNTDTIIHFLKYFGGLSLGDTCWSILEIYYRISQFRFIFEIWLSLIQENSTKMESILLDSYMTRINLIKDTFMNSATVLNEDMGEMEKNLEEEYMMEEYKNSTPLEFGINILNQALSREISEKIQAGYTFKENKFIFERMIFSLFELAYDNLAINFSPNTTIANCEYCGSPFQKRHKSRRFCPPLPGNKTSSCQNAYNNEIKKKQRRTKK